MRLLNHHLQTNFYQKFARHSVIILLTIITIAKRKQCKAHVLDGRRCGKKARYHSDFCHYHRHNATQNAPQNPPRGPKTAFSSTEAVSEDPPANLVEEDNAGHAPTTTPPEKGSPVSFATSFNAISGSSINENVRARRFPMAANLVCRSYISSTLWDTFLKDLPDIPQELIHDLYKKDEWKSFIAKCTGRDKNDFEGCRSSDSNEKEFRELVQCIAELNGLKKYFGTQQKAQEEPDFNKISPRRVRISHQGRHRMKTWRADAKWLRGGTPSESELKLDLMSILVRPEAHKSRSKIVEPDIPQTILPPPKDWKPSPMNDENAPIVEWKEPVWECLDLFWELKANSNALKNAEVYLDCSLKAAEALRFQWSRRYIYCFLHCGTEMQLLHFDRSGLMASNTIDIKTDTAKFIQCLLAVFLHNPAKLGYPMGRYAPVHEYDSGNQLRQVVTVDNRRLYIDKQEAGPLRDHLASRATTVFKAKLVEPKGREKTGWDWCYKSSWAQKNQKHEGEFLKRLQQVPYVVDLLAYSVLKVKDEDKDREDTTVIGRGGCSSGEPMALLNPCFKGGDDGGMLLYYTYRNCNLRYTIQSKTTQGQITAGV